MSQLAHALVRNPRRTRLVAGGVVIAALAFALVWIGRASAEQGSVAAPADASKSASTAVAKADGVDSTAAACTTLEQFVDMPSMLVSFRVGGNAPRAVIALFQGEFNLEGASVVVRLTIDGVAQSGPTPFAHSGNDLGSHGFNFISDPLAPGLHVARIQWFTNGPAACVADRSLIILHK